MNHQYLAMYRYKLLWRIRYVFTSLAAVIVAALFWIVDQPDHDGPLKALAMLLAINAFAWIFSSWKDPLAFEVSDKELTAHFLFGRFLKFPWAEIVNVSHLGTKKSKNGFGQEELELIAGNRRIYIVKCLENYSELENEVLSRSNSRQ